MKEYRTYAIEFRSGEHPSLMWIKDGLLRYFGYIQNIGEYDPDYHTIVRDYGRVADDNDTMDKAEIRFATDFPPEEGMPGPIGWLLPDGRFFACDTTEHDSVASYIYKYVYQKAPYNYSEISFIAHVEALGWLRVTSTCIRYADDYKATRKQIDVLFELIALSDDKRFKNSVQCDIEDFVE